MKSVKKIIVIIISIIIVLGILIAIPLLIEKLIFQNDVFSVISNEAWTSFFGSYIGGVLGGICTLLAIYFSLKGIKGSIKQNKESQLINSRSYIDIDNFQGNIKLSNYPGMSGRIRIVHNSFYKKAINYLKKKEESIHVEYPQKNHEKKRLAKLDMLNKEIFSYIILSNISDNPMYECRVDIQLSSNGEYISDVYTIPCVRGNEEIGIMVYDCDIKCMQNIIAINVKYKTSMNERMGYVFDFKKSTQKYLLLDQHGKQKEELMKNTFEPLVWTKVKL
ncbi:MAG: hypothetical protein COA82_07945 [Alkaliphilus sp.]|nr:hypothetical protein [bacterium AH-315-L21]MBN4067889.1 hypothetical protein [Alkaliphilus transvaalensis]PHS33913.1 MAG: hypothetical protein COA82_07945 [Alkaliphilus sp.]